MGERAEHLTKEQINQMKQEQEEKAIQSRRERSTSGFYDENYWDVYWRKRFNVEPREDHETVKTEVEKKINFIENYMGKVESMLDCGCSFGFFVTGMRDRECDAWGIDISQPALDLAPERTKPFLKRMNVTKIEFPDDRFTLVTAFDILEHLYIEEIEKALPEINRVAAQFILIRLPVPAFEAEPWVADCSGRSLDRSHVSCYPWEFWARRLTRIGKFRWWFAHLWDDGSDYNSCEGWIVFRRKE